MDPDQLDFFLGIVTDRTDSTFKSSDDQAVADAVHKVLTSPLGNHSVFPDPLQDRLCHFTQAFSDKSLIDMVLVPFPVSQFRTVHIFRLLSSEHDDTISILQH